MKKFMFLLVTGLLVGFLLLNFNKSVLTFFRNNTMGGVILFLAIVNAGFLFKKYVQFKLFNFNNIILLFFVYLGAFYPRHEHLSIVAFRILILVLFIILISYVFHFKSSKDSPKK